jgi:hypothetical protein
MEQIVELVIELQESVGWINRLSTCSLNLVCRTSLSVGSYIVVEEIAKKFDGL